MKPNVLAGLAAAAFALSAWLVVETVVAMAAFQAFDAVLFRLPPFRAALMTAFAGAALLRARRLLAAGRPEGAAPWLVALGAYAGGAAGYLAWTLPGWGMRRWIFVDALAVPLAQPGFFLGPVLVGTLLGGGLVYAVLRNRRGGPLTRPARSPGLVRAGVGLVALACASLVAGWFAVEGFGFLGIVAIAAPVLAAGGVLVLLGRGWKRPSGGVGPNPWGYAVLTGVLAGAVAVLVEGEMGSAPVLALSAAVVAPLRPLDRIFSDTVLVVEVVAGAVAFFVVARRPRVIAGGAGPSS